MSLNPINITLTTLQISGNPTGEGRLLGVRDVFEYADGKKTDKVIGQKYIVCFPNNSYEKLGVKIKGDKPVITNEVIQQKGGEVKVVLKNLSGRFYLTRTGDYDVSVTADGIEVLG